MSKQAIKQPPIRTFQAIRDALLIIKTRKDIKGNHYNDIGVLNQSAWVGENAQVLIERIDSLESALRCALRQDPGHWQEIGHAALRQTPNQKEQE